jgi:hypothetical protein
VYYRVRGSIQAPIHCWMFNANQVTICECSYKADRSPVRTHRQGAPLCVYNPYTVCTRSFLLLLNLDIKGQTGYYASTTAPGADYLGRKAGISVSTSHQRTCPCVTGIGGMGLTHQRCRPGGKDDRAFLHCAAANEEPEPASHDSQRRHTRMRLL